MTYCHLHVDVTYFTDADFCVVFQRFVSIVFKFTWGHYVKDQTAMLIGISPELEMALYTLCLRARPDKNCWVTLAGKPFLIQTILKRGKLRNAFFRA